MAKPVTTKFGDFVVLLGDGATPTENFTRPCGFTDKSFELKAATNSTQVPDCDDPDAPAWEEKAVTVLSASVSGQGVMANESQDDWRAFFFGATSRNVRVQTLASIQNGGGYYQGAAILTSLKLDASLGDKVKCSVSLENDGPWAWTAAASA